MSNATFDHLNELLKGCLKNDRRAQQALFTEFFGLFLGICLRYADNEDDAHDMVQNSFIKIFSKIKTYNQKGSFEGWMKRIVVNTAIDYYRAKDKATIALTDGTAVEIDDSVDEEFGITDAIIERLGMDKVMLLISELSPAYRAVFNMYEIEGFTHKEIGDALGIAEGTSKSNLAKAKLKLRKAIEELMTRKNVS